MSMHCGSAKVDGGRPRKPIIIHSDEVVRVPRLVRVSAGTYDMGAPLDEAGRFGREGPQHSETIGGFEVGVFPVTKEEYREFVTATHHPTPKGAWAHDDELRWREVEELTWERPGFEQGDDHPVVCVSWEDATAYAAWLAAETGKGFRLLTEAEWEYAARAGTTTPYHFGNSIPTGDANCMGWKEAMPPDMAARRGTCPVSSHGPNAFGLHGVHGNVWEWVDDRWRDSYEDDPPRKGVRRESEDRSWGQCSCVQDFRDYQYGGDGPEDRPESVVQSETCPCRVIRGGSWANKPNRLRSAFRIGWRQDYRAYSIGFRIACSLDER